MSRTKPSESNVARTPSAETPEDFVLQLHNSGDRLSKEEIARHLARAFHGRQESSAEDRAFVDRVLTNRES